MNSSAPSSNSFKREVLFLLLLLIAVLGSRLPFLMHGLDEWDSANFALSVLRFDVLNHQPHPPGQWVYVRLMQGLNLLTGNELLTLSLGSALCSSLALVPYHVALRQFLRPAAAGGAAILTAFTFGFWITGLRMVSDPVATLFVYGTVCCLLVGLRCPGWFVFGMALCGLTLGVKQTAVYFLAPFALAVNGVVLYRSGPRRPLLGSLCFAVAVVAWLLPTVHNVGGWGKYLSVCSSVQRENYNVESIIFHLTREAARTQVEQNFLQPWGSTALAVVMMTLIVIGVGLCLWRGTAGRLFALFGLTVAFYAFFFLFRFNKYWAYSVPVYSAFASAAIFAIGDAVFRRVSSPGWRDVVPWLAVAVITGANIFQAAPLLSKVAHFRAPPQAALESLRKMPGVGATPLLLTDDLTTSHGLTYFHWKGRIDLLNLRPDLQSAATALNEGRKVYFLSPLDFDVTSDQPDAIRLLGRYVWRPELYGVLQGRPDVRALSLYEVAASLSTSYEFGTAVPPPPLLQQGMWEDGWCGFYSRLLLPAEADGSALAHLRFTVPADHGYRFPYLLACELADGSRRELVVEKPGRADWVLPLPGGSGARTTEIRLFAPQTSSPAQRGPRSTDSRTLSVHLDVLECVTTDKPLLLRRESGWHGAEADGAAQSTWTDGNAVLTVLSKFPGTLVIKGEILSYTPGNTVELLVDGRQAQAVPLPGTDWVPVTWKLPLEAGFYRVTFHSQNPGVQPPGDGRALALRLRNLQIAGMEQP